MGLTLNVKTFLKNMLGIFFTTRGTGVTGGAVSVEEKYGYIAKNKPPEFPLDNKYLTWFSVIRRCDSNTPHCVLVHIAKSHGVSDCEDLSNNDLLEKIIKHPYLKYTDENYEPKKACFINSNVIWNKNHLNSAFLFWKKIENIMNNERKIGIVLFRSLLLDETDFHLGIPTNKNPIALSPGILFALVTRFTSLECNNFTTPKDMILALKKIFTSLEYTENKESIDDDVDPILIAGKKYSFDLSWVKEPSMQREQLKHLTSGVRCFTDPFLKKWYSRNPFLFNLRYTFNNNLPRECYTENDIRAIYHYNGGSLNENHSITDMVVYIQIASLLNNFYWGDHPNIKNRKTLLYQTDLDEIPNYQILSYGLITGEMQGTTFSELLTIFKEKKYFANLFHFEDSYLISKPIFTNLNIRKLQNIINTCISIYTKDKPMELESIIQLRDYIVELQKIPNEDTFLILLLDRFKSEENQLIICLRKMFQLAMYMRGWNPDLSGNEYPIEKAISDESEFTEINLRCTIAVNQLEIEINKLSKSHNFLDLPCFKWVNGFYIKSDLVENDTIGSRIQNIKIGNEDDVNSCIRNSSNYLAATYYRYMKLMNLPVEFDITKLRFIS